MDFFKSILLDDLDSTESETSREAGEDSREEEDQNRKIRNDDVAAANDNADGGWSFGSLFQNLTTRSESVFETYRRDLQEFGSGLKMETEIIREGASRAVKDLPASLEAGTTAAHGVLDGVIKSTADIISKEVHIFGADSEPTAETNRNLNPGRYSWFDAQLNSIRCEPSTFCDEPEDVEDYRNWKLGFELVEKKDEIDGLIGENGILEGVYRKFVPSMIDHEMFWCRYFYRVDKLEQQEKFRANLVKRVISGDDEDDLTWDCDDNDDGEEDSRVGKPVGTVDQLKDQEMVDGVNGDKIGVVESSGLKVDELKDQEIVDGVNGDKIGVVGSRSVGEVAELKDQEIVDGVGRDNINVVGSSSLKPVGELKDQEMVDGVNVDKIGVVESMKMSCGDMSSMEENDEMGWDEIGDTGSGDDDKNDSKTSIKEKPIRVDIMKHLNAAEDDEDLSWGIDGDDEPMKS